jgi:hypothetical protein
MIINSLLVNIVMSLLVATRGRSPGLWWLAPSGSPYTGLDFGDLPLGL